MTPVGDRQARRDKKPPEQQAGGDPRLDALVERLPPRLADTAGYLLKPSNRWVRVPSGALLIAGGVLSFLPLLGVWMLPLGLALLAEDVPVLRKQRSKVLDWIERRKPHWLRQDSPPADRK
jgi:hypothetical protein